MLPDMDAQLLKILGITVVTLAAIWFVISVSRLQSTARTLERELNDLRIQLDTIEDDIERKLVPKQVNTPNHCKAVSSPGDFIPPTHGDTGLLWIDPNPPIDEVATIKRLQHLTDQRIISKDSDLALNRPLSRPNRFDTQPDDITPLLATAYIHTHDTSPSHDHSHSDSTPESGSCDCSSSDSGCSSD